MALDLGGIVAWVVVGLIAGWLAGQFVKGGGYGVVGDLTLGIAGAVIGGLLFGSVAPGGVGWIGRIFVAFIGAVILIAAARVLSPGRRFGR